MCPIYDENDVIVCTECWNEIPPPKFSKDDGPLVCPECGACDPRVEHMDRTEFDQMNSGGRQGKFIRLRIKELERELSKVSEEVRNYIESEEFQNGGLSHEKIPEAAIKAIEIRAELADLKDVIGQWEPEKQRHSHGT